MGAKQHLARLIDQGEIGFTAAPFDRERQVFGGLSMHAPGILRDWVLPSHPKNKRPRAMSRLGTSVCIVSVDYV